MTYTKQDLRDSKIQEIVEKWICTDAAFELGMLAHGGSFDELAQDVQALRKLGRSPRWQRAIHDWEHCIATAFDVFYNFEFGPDNLNITAEEAMKLGDVAFSHNTTREFARLIKWAVMEGANYAYIGNR